LLVLYLPTAGLPKQLEGRELGIPMEPKPVGEELVVGVVPNAAGRAGDTQNVSARVVVTKPVVVVSAVVVVAAVNFYNNTNFILHYYICLQKQQPRNSKDGRGQEGRILWHAPQEERLEKRNGKQIMQPVPLLVLDKNRIVQQEGRGRLLKNIINKQRSNHTCCAWR